jgi:hypothetical protein
MARKQTAFARQRLGEHVPASTNTHATIELLDAVFLCGPCHEYSICTENKVADKFLPELLVFICGLLEMLTVVHLV